MRVNELLLYRHMDQGQILNDMAFLMDNYDNEYYNREDLIGLLCDCVNEILEFAVSHRNLCLDPCKKPGHAVPVCGKAPHQNKGGKG